MKISILSLGVHGTHENYGAVLQILAFQEYLKKNFDAEVSVINYYGISNKKDLFLEEKYFWGKLKKIKRNIRNILMLLTRKKMALRLRKNELFITKNLNITKKYTYRSIENATFVTDAFIAESDVIWDPSFRGQGFDNTYFLNSKCFEKGKKIVYAASMGDIKFSDQDKKIFLELISGLDCFSVREIYAKKYIENCGMQTETFVDPTLLMDKDFYDQYIKRIHKRIKKPYIVVYFPAEVNKEVLFSAEKYSRTHNCDILYLCRTEIENRDVKIEYGIEEFLYYIKHCTAVFCDSFHGICFSIIYEKTFYAFIRDDGKKIVDICNRLELDDYVIHDGLLPDAAIPYNHVYQLLEQERKRAYRWLEKALEMPKVEG